MTPQPGDVTPADLAKHLTHPHNSPIDEKPQP